MKIIKRIIVTVIVLALVAVGMPYLLGMQAKRIYERNIAFIASETALPIRSTVYHEGIFNSDAITEFKIGETTMQVNHKIHHGPIIFDNSSTKPNGLRFGLAWIQHSINFVPPIPEYEKLRQKLADKELFSWKSLITYNGGMKNYIYSPAVEHTTEAGMNIGWQGMDGQVSNDRRYKSFSGFLNMPGLMLKASNFSGGFKELYDNFHSLRADYNLWVGKWTYSLKEGEFNPGSDQYMMQDFKWDTEAKLENQLYRFGSDLELNRLQTPKGQYGPFVVHLQLLNLDPEGVNLLQEEMNRPLSKRSQFKIAMQKILSKTPTLVIENTHFSFPEGDMRVEAKLSLNTANEDMNTTQNNAVQYTNTLEGTVKANMTPQVLEMFLAMALEKAVYAKPEVLKLSPAEQKAELDKAVALKIEKLKNSGLLTEQDKNYELKFDIQKEKVMINGKEVNESEL